MELMIWWQNFYLFLINTIGRKWKQKWIQLSILNGKRWMLHHWKKNKLIHQTTNDEDELEKCLAFLSERNFGAVSKFDKPTTINYTILFFLLLFLKNVSFYFPFEISWQPFDFNLCHYYSLSWLHKKQIYLPSSIKGITKRGKRVRIQCLG